MGEQIGKYPNDSPTREIQGFEDEWHYVTSVERLARQLVRTGCATCREDEAAVRMHWIDEGVNELPESATCQACGRTYPLKYTVLRWADQ